MMSDLATTVVWSGIQVSIFALIVAGTVLVIRKWLGGLVREILTVSLAVIILVPLLSTVPIPNWFSGSAGASVMAVPAVETVSSKPIDLEPASPVAEDSNAFVPFDSQPVEQITDRNADQSNSISAPVWTTKLAEFWEQLQSEPIEIEPEVSAALPVSIPAVVGDSPRMTWLNLLFFAILFCVAIGLVRLVIGIRAVARLRKRSTQIDNEFAASEIERLCGLMGVRRHVELLQSEELSTPATVGWLNPVVLLPASCGSWSESELSSSIAHELAHVASADFAKNLVGQIAVALNFYNPIVHYLGRELRVAQELAADALAASAAGGRRNYLATMAQMALEQDTRQMGWLAQPFLPTRKTLLRRIEMLKGKRRFRGMRSVPAIWLARVAILAVALACVCFRLPVVESAAARVQESELQRPAKAAQLVDRVPDVQPATQLSVAPSKDAWSVSTQESDPFEQREDVRDEPARAFQSDDRWSPRPWAGTFVRPDQEHGFASDRASVPTGVAAAVIGKSSSIAFNKLAYVANKTRFFAAVDFDGLSQIESLPGLLKKFSGSDSAGNRLFVDLHKLRSATLQVYDNSGGLVLNFRELLPDGFQERLNGKKFKYRGQVCVDLDEGFCFHVVPQSATVLFGDNRDNLTTMLDSKNGPTIAGWSRINADTFKRPIVVGASELGFEMLRSLTHPNELEIFSSLWKDSKCAVAGLNLVDGELRLDAFALGNDPTAAKSVSETVTAAKVVAKNTFLKNDEPKILLFSDVAQPVHQLISGAVNNIAVSQNGNLVSMNSKVRASEQLLSKILASISNDLGPLRYKTDNLNNIIQIALAMHNYESAYQRFPPASSTESRAFPIQANHPEMKQDHPHSWRIAILPFIEQNELYQKYKFDEPWDSPHNAKVTADMPDIFRHPSQPRDSRNSCYYLVVGDKTMFPPDGRRISFEHISDGTSNSIMIVEAKRDVHWAKPDDIAYDPETLADQLGGFTPGEFVVAIGDGSVTTLRNDAVAQNKTALSHLVEIADGNIVQVDDLKRVPKTSGESVNNRFAQPPVGTRVSSPATQFSNAVPLKTVPLNAVPKNAVPKNGVPKNGVPIEPISPNTFSPARNKDK